MQANPEDEGTEAILLVGAQNAFNVLNRQNALLNIHHFLSVHCLILTKCIEGVNLYVQSETVISTEVVTQGDPLAVDMFAMGSLRS